MLDLAALFDSTLELPPNVVATDRAMYPVQAVVDFGESRHVVGMTAVYGPNTDVNVLARALDERYARWRVPELRYTWRLEDERVALALREAGEWVVMFYLPFAPVPPERREISGPCSCPDAQ
jgi:hypothetical protein